MTSVNETAGRALSEPAPALAGPCVPEKKLPLLPFLRVLRDSAIATHPAAAYSEDVFTRRVLWKRAFYVNEPNAVKHVLLDNAANYQKAETMRSMLEPGLGRGLLTSEGDIWRRHRRMLSPFFDHRSVSAFSVVMTDIAQSLVRDWDALPDGSEVDVAAAMMRATLRVISRSMFASDADDISEVVGQSIARYQASMRPSLAAFLGFPEWLRRSLSSSRGASTLRPLDQMLDRLMAERADGRQRSSNDLLSRLMRARDDEKGGGMSAKEVRDEVVTLFVAGHETTSWALTWTWYLLSLHRHVERELEDELSRVLGERFPCYEDLSGLRCARMIIDEALRLYPPAHTLTRTAKAEDHILGHRIPRAAHVVIVPWLLHRNPKLWDEPERFDPKRFLPERVAVRHRFSYIPFGAGPRTCIGASFAMAEAMLILSTVAQRYRLRLKPGFPVEPQALITLRARHGMRMLLSRRH